MHRDTLERKTNGELAAEEHLLIRKGDIAYNMMRMWQGASGLAETDGIVSPAYVVVTPKNSRDHSGRRNKLGLAFFDAASAKVWG